MNTIIIYAPRWRDKTVLIAERRLLDHNEIAITYKDKTGQRIYPRNLYLAGSVAKEYPLEDMQTKAGGVIAVRAVPLSELEKERLV